MGTRPLSDDEREQTLAELHQIMTTMDVPPMRRLDLGWLQRNIHVRNFAHPQFEHALELIRRLKYGAIEL